MNNVILIKVNGMLSSEYRKMMRNELMKEIKEGLFIVDDSVKDVIVTTIDELGIKE